MIFLPCWYYEDLNKLLKLSSDKNEDTAKLIQKEHIESNSVSIY